MKITAVTTWEGTPKAIELLIEGSRMSAEVHKEMGAKTLVYSEPLRAMICRRRTIISISTPTLPTVHLQMQ